MTQPGDGTDPLPLIRLATVGTAEGQGFVADDTQVDRAPPQACDRGQRIAERIVASLPRLSGK